MTLAPSIKEITDGFTRRSINLTGFTRRSINLTGFTRQKKIQVQCTKNIYTYL